MRLFTIILVLVCSCFCIASVSGACESTAAATGLAMLAQQGEQSAFECSARGSHADAAQLYAWTAEIYEAKAKILKGQRDYRGAATFYVKAAAACAASILHERAIPRATPLFAALGQHEAVSFLDVVGGFAEMGSYRRELSLHEQAACCYSIRARAFTKAGDRGSAHGMSQAAIGQLEAAVHCALSHHDSFNAAYYCFRAAGCCKSIGDDDKARSMSAMAAQCSETHAADRAAHGRHEEAADSYCSAARLYHELDKPRQAQRANEAAAWHYKAFAEGRIAHGDYKAAVGAYRAAEQAHEALGQDEQVQSARHAVAEQLKNRAVQLVAGGNHEDAAWVFASAAAVYETLGLKEEESAMKRAGKAQLDTHARRE